MTTAHLVLASIALLLALLAHGRVGPAVQFAAWAGGYHLLGLASQQELLASFSNPALATLILLLLVSLALERSPLLDHLSELLLKGRVGLATLRLSVFACLISAFMNNTAVVGALLGTVTSQRRHPASKLLIPLSYASILGGITTLVGTSTNLVVNSFVIDAGLPPLQMFQFAWVGIPVALACIGVMTLSSRLGPANASTEAEARSACFLEARMAAGLGELGDVMRGTAGVQREALRGERETFRAASRIETIDVQRVERLADQRARLLLADNRQEQRDAQRAADQAPTWQAQATTPAAQPSGEGRRAFRYIE